MLFKRVEVTKGDRLRKAVRPLLVVCRAFGLLPSSSAYKFSIGWMRYSLILCAAWVFSNTVMKWVIVILYEVSYLDTFITKLLNILQSFVESLCILAHIISIVVNRAGFNRIFIGLRGLQNFKEIHLYPNFGVLLCLLKTLIQLTVHVSVHGVGFNGSTFVFMATLMGNLVFCLINVEYCGILEILRYQFHIVTEDLSPSHHILMQLTKRHHVLLELTTTLNEIFSWQLLVMCTGIFLNIVTTLYSCIRALQSMMLLTVLGMSGLWFWQILQLFSLAVSCEETREKAEAFNAELFKLMRESKDLCSNEKLHLYVTVKQSLNFSACGFFSIGYPLVTSIIAAATTYLVILVQFSMSDHK